MHALIPLLAACPVLYGLLALPPASVPSPPMPPAPQGRMRPGPAQAPQLARMGYWSGFL